MDTSHIRHSCLLGPLEPVADEIPMAVVAVGSSWSMQSCPRFASFTCTSLCLHFVYQSSILGLDFSVRPGPGTTTIFPERTAVPVAGWVGSIFENLAVVAMQL